MKGGKKEMGISNKNKKRGGRIKKEYFKRKMDKNKIKSISQIFFSYNKFLFCHLVKEISSNLFL